MLAVAFTYPSYAAKGPSLQRIQVPLDIPEYVLEHTSDMILKSELATYLVTTYCAQQKPAQARQLIDRLPESLASLKSALYNIWIAAYYTTLLRDDTHEWLSTIPDRYHTELIAYLFELACSKQRLDDAHSLLSLAKTSHQYHYRIQALVTLALALEKPAVAIQYYSLLPPSKARHLARIALLIAAAKQDNAAQVNLLLQELPTAAEQTQAIDRIVQALATSEHKDRGIVYLNRLNNTLFYDNAAASLSMAYATDLQIPTATRLLNTIQTTQPRQRTAIALAVAHVAQNERAMAQSYYNTLTTPTLQSRYHVALAHAYVLQGDIDASFGHIRQTPLSLQRTHLPTLATEYGRLRANPFTLLLLQKINDTVLYEQTLGAYAISLAQHNQHQAARQALVLINDVNKRDDCMATLLKDQPMATGLRYQTLISPDVAVAYLPHLQPDPDTRQVQALQTWTDTFLPADIRTPYDTFMLLLAQGHATLKTANPNKANGYAKKLRKLYKKGVAASLTPTELYDYITLLSQTNLRKKIWSDLTRYPNKEEGLFVLDTLSLSSYSPSKKAMRSYGKSLHPLI